MNIGLNPKDPKNMFMGIFTSTQVWLLLLVVLFLAFLSLHLLKLNKKKKATRVLKLPPSPPKLPIIGNLHQLGKLPHCSLWKLSQNYGPLMLLQLGKVPTLIISSSNMAKQVLKTHDLNFCSRPPSPGAKRLSYNFLDVAFSPYSDHWREMRKLFVSELLNPKRVQYSWQAREVEVDRMINHLSKASPNPVNLDEEIFTLVSGVVCKVAFGKSFGGKEFKDQKFKDFLEETMKMMGSFSAEDFFPYGGWVIDILTGLKRRLERCFRNLDEFFEMVLDEHLDAARHTLDYQDFVDVLIGLPKFQKQNGGFDFTKEHMKAILLNTFIGGIDTTAVTMVWAMAELVNNPRVMQKVQAEIRSCIGKKSKVSPKDITKLRYLSMVLKETLRMHPAAPLLLPHENISSCKIGGFDINPRTRVLINAYAIGRDQNSWKSPNEFFPERFQDSDIDFKGQHFELIPFGSGRRFCPALAMACGTMEFTLANLLYWFDWELPCGMKIEDMSMEEEGGVTIHKKISLCLVPIRYNWQEKDV